VWRPCEIAQVGTFNIRVRYANNSGPHAGLHIRDGADVYDMPFCESVVTRILQGPAHVDSVDIFTLFVHSHMGNHMTRRVQDITLLHVSPSLGREFLDPQTNVRSDMRYVGYNYSNSDALTTDEFLLQAHCFNSRLKPRNFRDR